MIKIFWPFRGSSNDGKLDGLLVLCGGKKRKGSNPEVVDARGNYPPDHERDPRDHTIYTLWESRTASDGVLQLEHPILEAIASTDRHVAEKLATIAYTFYQAGLQVGAKQKQTELESRLLDLIRPPNKGTSE